jgi:undecaprenyl phosphate-alpha-L-ara4FN deformylase
MITVGLRIDVDTLRGTRIGVPHLLELLATSQIRASFFFSVGPDNMGRNLWRLLRPTFLLKMLRTKAASLYGWDILLCGTFYPGPVIGKKCPDVIRQAADAGHEIGLHAWDHHKWQSQLENMEKEAVTSEIQQGYDLLTRIVGRQPDCFAAPAWRITPEALQILEQFTFNYQSDCRGYSLFRPLLDGSAMNHIQIPATLPTYDELIGRQCTQKTYNEYLLTLIKPDILNVLTIHAEAEGISCLSLFKDFLDKAARRNISFVPLGDLIAGSLKIEASVLAQSTIAGRDGWLSCQEELPL